MSQVKGVATFFDIGVEDEVFGVNGALRRLRSEDIAVAAGMVFMACGVTTGLALMPAVTLALVVVAAAGFVPAVGWFGLGLAHQLVARVHTN